MPARAGISKTTHKRPNARKVHMKIKIEVSPDELEEMGCDSIAEFEQEIRHQLDNGIVTDDGGNGTDWMVDYELEVVPA